MLMCVGTVPVVKPIGHDESLAFILRQKGFLKFLRRGIYAYHMFSSFFFFFAKTISE